MTFRQIAERLGISQQRASAIFKSGISKLRQRHQAHVDQVLETAQFFSKPQPRPSGNARQRRKQKRAESRRNKLAAV